MMFKKILIANRGEIACRVIRACREMDIASVAIYSDADADALHVRMADEAYRVGPPPSSESYLNREVIIETALNARAEAIHPGYGFLSENGEFAKAVIDAGLTFIGPSPEVMVLMGGKIDARKVAISSGVPVVPGTVEPISDLETALNEAANFGYPVMLKAAAGGGGKGMRLVSDDAELRNALELARSEAQASFGDDAVYIEKAIVRPRHIEIQIFSDNHGNHVHLGERECSIQRRHQKVVEEAPSPIGSSDLRAAMGDCAVKIAEAVGYVGAGTIEFLVSDIDHSFYFLEMNTRLQVEHPVTEMVTGIDLVREQIRVASGERLSFGQDDIVMSGHAIECRIYAEDPENGFLPSPGKISRLRIPQGPGLRDDGGVFEGSVVSIFYDPMISKFVVHGRDRSEAVEKMRRALREYEICGIKTTLGFFRDLFRDGEFIAGDLDTGFIDRFLERQKTVCPSGNDISHIAAIAAAETHLKKSAAPSQRTQPSSSESQWLQNGRSAQLRGR